MNAAIAFFQDHQIQLTDARRGNFPLAIVHEMAKANKRTSQPRRTMTECLAIAKHIEAKIVKDEGKYFISTPKLPLRCFISRGSIRALYNELHEIRDLVLAAMSDAEVATKAAEYKSDF